MGLKKQSHFAIYTWVTLGLNVLVVLWGAYVRATGSGAGCGSHWPLCNGVILPRSPQAETIIEFAHRISSGAALLLVLILFIWGLKTYRKGSPVRLGVSLSMIFIITEALVGAMLVLFSWVAYDQSTARVISVSIHLINTFLLLGSLTLTAWWASGGSVIALEGRGILAWTLIGSLIAVLILGVSGAINALGDTLFPAGSLTEGIQQDFAPTAHFLVRLRVFHPVLAIITALFIYFVVLMIGLSEDHQVTKKLAWLVGIIFSVQLLAGIVNLILLAPIPMQIVHLLLADLAWISLILLSASSLRIKADDFAVKI